MASEDEVVIRLARRAELKSVLAVQHQAFGRVAQGFGIDPGHLPPLRESVADLQLAFDGGMRFFVAVTSSGDVVGSVRAEQRDGTVEVGRLVVGDAWLRRGVATELMAALEAAYPQAARFELFTGAEAREPLALYAKLGYTVYRSVSDGPVELVWLEKRGPAGLD